MTEDSDCPEAGPRWSLRTRLIASALILFQVTAVFWPPFTFAGSFGNGSSSPFADGVMSWLRPYASLMFLDHGYFFFAPNPGPAHLVRFKVEFADGRKPVEGTFPDKQEYRPRLFYHRHFMLAEALYDAYIPPEAPQTPPLPARLTEAERQELKAEQEQALAAQTVFWKNRRERYEQLRKSFEDHLLDKYGGSKVTIIRVEHLIPLPDQFKRGGKRLDLPESYENLPEGRQSEVIRP